MKYRFDLKFKIKKLKFTMIARILGGVAAVAFVVYLFTSGILKFQGALAGWWPDGGTAWLNRKQLTLTNNSGGNLNANAVVTVTIDTQSLYTLGKLKSDCSDLHIVYNPNSTTYKDLNRYVGFASGTTCSTSTSSKVSFALQAAVSNAASSTDYYLYYNNPDATAPTNNQTAFSVGASTATFVCPFDGSSTCLAAGTAAPTTETGAIRYSGSKSAMSFDGISDLLTVGSGVPQATSQLTLEGWFYFKGTISAKHLRLIERWSDNGSNGYQLESYNGMIGLFVFQSGVLKSWRTSALLSPDQWYHIAVTFNGGVATSFLNGVQQSWNTTASGVNSTLNAQTGNTYIGAQGGYDGFMPGIIDEIRVSNNVRYASNFTSPTAPFVRDSNTLLLLHFDENGDDPRNTGKAIDDSGNGNHGTITGAKYVAGLVGVDASTTNTGNVPRQSYAGHEGVFVEEATTNKITNPSFENGTFDTNWTGAATAQTLTLQPDGTNGIDTFLRGSGPTSNHGTETVLTVSDTETDAALLKFDISSIPSNATISSSVLTLTKTNTWSSISMDIRVFAILRAWVEGQATHNVWITGNSWTTAGALSGGNDRDTTIQDTQTITGDGTYNFNVLDATSRWVSGSLTNNGIGLYQNNNPSTYKEFSSSDHATAANRPKLVVNYTPTFTVTQNTTAPYYKFGSNSAKIVAGGDGTFVTSINPGNTNTHMLSAYVYDGTSGNVGGTVGSTVAKLVYRGTAQTTTYTDMGGGWWRLTYSAAAANAAENYGVQVLSGKTVYIDGVQLEEKAYATTYTDGTLGTGYAWTGTANNSTSTRTAGSLQYARASNISGSGGTVSVWIKMNSTPASRQPFINLQDDSYNRIFLQYRPDTGAMQYYWGSSSNLTSFSPTLGNWYHFVLTSSGTNSTLYINNVAGTVGGGNTFTPNTAIFVGSSPESANYFANATISDLRIYNSALTSTDVSDLYYSGLVGHSENIVLDRFGGGDTKGQDPLAVWHMDEGYGTTVNDSSRNSKPLTASGTTWESGIGNTRSARARFLKFDGSTSYLSRAQDGSFDFGTGSFSLSGWYHHNSTAPASGTHTILARYGTAGFKVYMNTSGYICFGIDADSTWTPADTACSGASEGSLADSKWHHLEAVKNGTTSISLYIDGHLAQTTSVTATGSMNTASSLYLGVDSTGNTNYWNGWLDEFMVYPYARSAAQVKTDLLDPVAVLIGSSATDPLSNGLVGYWKMDEAAANSCTGGANDSCDSSGNVNDGAWNGDATATIGKFSNGVIFDGTGDYVSTTADTNFQFANTTFSVAGWFKTSQSSAGYIVARGADQEGWGINVNHLEGGKLGVMLKNSAGTAATRTSSTSVNDGNWHQYTAVITTNTTSAAGNDITIYLDGKLDQGNLTKTLPYTVGTVNLSFGARSGGTLTFFNGSIDEARIYNRALTPKEVRDLYNWAPGPAAYLPMDEGSGTSANDSSGNSRTGTLNDGPLWAPGKFGKGVKLDGSNDDVSVPDFGY